MLKKLSIIALFLLSTNLIYALPYIGLSSGVLVNTSDDFEIYDHGIYSRQPINYREVPLTLFAGYGVDLRSAFYLGGEIFVTPMLAKLNSSSYGRGYLNMTYNYGISFTPGIQVSEHTLAYIRLGWIGAHFQSLDNNVNGGQFGVGLRSSITQHLDLRAEYSISSYFVNGNDEVIVNPFRVSPIIDSDQFSFGLVYRF